MTNQRKSFQHLNRIYFWTATIHNWECILESDSTKEKIIEVLEWLAFKQFVTVYAFVIMPNHIHVIWEQKKFYGREAPLSTFLKRTAMYLLKELTKAGKDHLYFVGKANKKREIWRRDSLAIEIFSMKIAEQKLEYIHANPISGKWQLAKDFLSYTYSSANFYEGFEDNYKFLKDLYDEFYGT
jgi:REP element-mobilizing transposase RayT